MKYLYQYFYLIIFSILIILSGLRTGVDPDYGSYYDIYKLSVFNYGENIEPFYFSLNKAFNYLGLPFESMIFIIALTSISIKYYVIIKEASLPIFSIIIYVASIYVMFDVIAIRQGLAISLAMLAFRHNKNNSLKSVLLITLGSLFHYSVLVLIPFIKITSFDHNKYFLYFLFAFIVVTTALKLQLAIDKIFYSIPYLPSFIMDKFKVYSSYELPAFLSFKQLVIAAMSIYVYSRRKVNNFTKRMALLYIYGAVVSILLGSVGDIAYRIKWYFFFSEIFFVPTFFIMFRFSIPNKLASKELILCIVLSLLYVLPLIDFIDSLHERNSGLFF